MNNKKENSPEAIFNKTRGILMGIILFVFILVFAFFFGEGGIVEIIKSRSRIDELNKEISQLETHRDNLLKEIKDLEKNPLALERKAREKLWLMKKNEKVVVIIRDKNSKQQETKKP